jgi:hypothetical protein
VSERGLCLQFAAAKYLVADEMGWYSVSRVLAAAIVWELLTKPSAVCLSIRCWVSGKILILFIYL